MQYVIVIGVFVLLILLIIFGAVTLWIWMDKFGRNLSTAERQRLAKLEAEVAELRQLAAALERDDEQPDV